MRVLRSAKPALLPLFLSALSLGCIPVATVSGRPAAVLPKGELRFGGTGGASVFEEELQSQTATGISPHIYLHGNFGLGWGTDCRVGGMIAGTEEDLLLGAQIWTDVRTQVLGRPYEGYPRAGSRPFPLDLSLELGCGAQVSALGAFSDWYYGANVSFPLAKATPYLSYRRHRGRFEGAGPGDDGAFGQDSVVAGLEYARSGMTYALEVFHGIPVGRVPADFDGSWTVWGVTLTFYHSADAPPEPLPPDDEPIPEP